MNKINDDINTKEVNLIQEGQPQTIMSLSSAILLAQDKDLDLVAVGKEKIPACKIMDYGKYRYSQDKKLKENKSKQRKNKSKEIKFSLNISQHDIDHKVKHTLEFLSEGRKVSLSLRLKGRNKALVPEAKSFLRNIISILGDSAKLEVSPNGTGGLIKAVVSPA